MGPRESGRKRNMVSRVAVFGARSGASSRWLGSLAWAVVLLVGVPSARADGPYAGTWREGPMSIQVAITSWGGDCGPRPQSTTTPGGGTFTITQDGDHLTFQMRRQRTTRGCWSENRAVRRVSSSAQAGTWRIVCRTPPEDSRSETGTYTLQAVSRDRITFRDVSQYDWQLNDSRCVATITTTQTFTRVSAPPVEVATETPPAPSQPACTPTAPARIVLRPTEAELTPGAEQCFTTRVVDAKGCTVRSARVELSLAEGPGRVEGACYRAGDSDGTARIVARTGSIRSEARVRVQAVDLSDLIARRSETGSVGGVLSGSGVTASADTKARVSTRNVEESFDWRWPALGFGIAVVFMAGGALALRRRRKPHTIAGLGSIDAIVGPPPEKPADGSDAVPLPDAATSQAEPPSSEETPRQDMICPRCRRGHPPGATHCVHDGTALVLYRDFVSGQAEDNVCPVCGARYPAHVRFCGKDGASLRAASS